MSGFQWANEAKWFRVIKEEEARTATGPPPPLAEFELGILGRDSAQSRFKVRFFNRFFLAYFWLARLFHLFPPLPTFPKVVCVARAADVKQVLGDSATFGVPYGPEMTKLAGGTDFMLGSDGPDHRKQRAWFLDCQREGDAELMREFGRRFAHALLDGCGGEINVMTDLVTRAAAETCARYFGMTVGEPDAFTEWALALSTLLFADPEGDPKKRALALNGAARIRAIADHAIAKAKADPARGDATLVERLVNLQGKPPGPADADIRAMLVGLVVGFVPTTTLAAGRMLEELLRRPAVLAEAARRAEAGDKSGLEAILWELARLNPALQPGQWRYARKDSVIGVKAIRAGTVLMVSTLSALRDGRTYPRPNRFDDKRKPTPGFIFGFGPHACLGTQLAMPLIIEVLAALLAKPGLRCVQQPAGGGVGWIGPLPRTLVMSFDGAPAPRTQTQITVLVPVRCGVMKADVDATLAGLGGNPAQEGSSLASALAATEIVHFASLSCVDVGDATHPSLQLLLELNVDGPADAAIAAVSHEARAVLAPIFSHAVGDEPLERLLRRYRLNPKPLSWNGPGLQFPGTPEFPVADIEQQAKLATFCREALEPYLRGHVGQGGRAWGALHHVRRLVQDDPGLRDLLVRPSGRKLGFPRPVSTEPWSPLQSLRDFFLVSRDGARAAGILACLLTIIVGLNYYALDILASLRVPHWHHWLTPSRAPQWSVILSRVMIALVTGAVGLALFLAGIALFLVWRLRIAETTDAVDDKPLDFADVVAAAAVENAPGYAQNHFMAVNQLKPGLLRRITLIGALLSIGNLVLTRYRKGFVLNMSTIHYAQWFKVPGEKTLIFLSNFDGSWESYLEDFIMRVHPGQSAVWSNCVGFPPTRYLTLDGAADGDRFKRFTRARQKLAPFWYSRFPQLTTGAMRENALIHYGLMRATNDAGARAWLRCFGSMQRPEGSIESDEAQSLVFTGMGDLLYAACALIRLPGTESQRRAWLTGVMRGCGMAVELTPLTFGERLDGGDATAACLAFTAEGLAKFGLPAREAADGLGVFPAPFTMGMAARSRALGDVGDAAPERWRWSDAAGEKGVDAALFVYGRTKADRDAALERHRAYLEALGGSVFKAVLTAPVEQAASEEYRREHFGFRDGISQPVMRGTQRFARDPLARDVVEPGEFLLGYAGNQGWYAPGLTVRAESDPHRNLPVENECAKIDPLASRDTFPDFDVLNRPYARRDFGRNGAFLAIRQLAQKVADFDAFTRAAAARVTSNYPHAAAIAGGPLTAEWIAAKMVGRWRDGTPLLDRSSVAPPSPARAARRAAKVGSGSRLNDPDNDFSYGADDPIGLMCPLGAHIRRANPRDSLQPGDLLEPLITNRHRLMRRGRSYERENEADGSVEKGLLFVAVCADLARQFEFVQQTWIGSPSFHGLCKEPDPLLGAGDDRSFTIPTDSGPIVLRGLSDFISLVAGGYFFLPSRSALMHLTELAPF